MSTNQNPSPSSVSPASAGEGVTRNVHAMALDRASVDLTLGKYAHVSTCVEAAHEIDRLQAEALRLRADAERLRERNGALEKALASIACGGDTGSWGARWMKNTATKALGLRCESDVRRAYFPALSERPAEGKGGEG